MQRGGAVQPSEPALVAYMYWELKRQHNVFRFLQLELGKFPLLPLPQGYAKFNAMIAGFYTEGGGPQGYPRLLPPPQEFLNITYKIMVK